jgi:integrase
VRGSLSVTTGGAEAEVAPKLEMGLTTLGLPTQNLGLLLHLTLAWMRKMFSWAASRDIVTLCPCLGVNSPAPETARDRVLSDSELTMIWEATDKMGQPFGPLIKLLILTAQRRDEFAAIRWSQLDLKRRKWAIRRERVKNDRLHEAPLSRAAIAVIKTVTRIKSAKDFVFTTTGHSAVSGFSRAKRRLDQEIRDLNGKSFEHWTLHDLRRTAATGMKKLDLPPPLTIQMPRPPFTLFALRL